MTYEFLTYEKLSSYTCCSNKKIPGVFICLQLPDKMVKRLKITEEKKSNETIYIYYKTKGKKSITVTWLCVARLNNNGNKVVLFFKIIIII